MLCRAGESWLRLQRLAIPYLRGLDLRLGSLSRLSFHDVRLDARKERFRGATAADQLVPTNQGPSHPSYFLPRGTIGIRPTFQRDSPFSKTSKFNQHTSLPTVKRIPTNPDDATPRPVKMTPYGEELD